MGAVRAGNADGLLLHVLTRGIVATRDELAEPSELLDQVVVALRALLFERHIGLLLRSADLLGRLAIRVSGAGVELTEAALLQDHGAAAILAVLFGVLLGEVFLVGVRLLYRQFAGV